MSLHEYQWGQKLSSMDIPFYALIQAAMRQADSYNLIKLKMEWPKVWDELHIRYNLPGGMLPEEMEREQ